MKRFTLDLSPRNFLIARMQAYVYENIVYGEYPTAQTMAESILEQFDAMLRENPCDEPGYWASVYFHKFVDKAVLLG